MSPGLTNRGKVCPSSPSSFLLWGPALGVLSPWECFSAPFCNPLFVFFPLVFLVPLLVCGWTWVMLNAAAPVSKGLFWSGDTAQHGAAVRSSARSAVRKWCHRRGGGGIPFFTLTPLLCGWTPSSHDELFDRYLCIPVCFGMIWKVRRFEILREISEHWKDMSGVEVAKEERESN